MSEDLTITSTDGLALEAALDLPAAPRALCVVCHPHPGFGGTMNAPLLLALRDDLLERNIGVLRFNFRGIGRSEGTSGLGEDEVNDVLGALEAARSRGGDVPLVLLGWSFGAAVAIRTAARASVAAVVAIAPAVQRKEGIVAGLPDPDELGLQIPLLVVIGENDEQVSPVACATWTRGVDGARLVEMPGANHFFWAKYPALAETIGSWLDEVL